MIYFLLIMILVISDRLSKAYFEKNYKINEFRQKKENFYLANVQNKGAAYGLLSKKPAILKLVSIFSFALVVYNFILAIKNNSSKITKIGLSFLMGGAIGNLSDRFRKGFVTDFLYIKYKKAPVFNLADVFVLIGVIFTFFSAGAGSGGAKNK